MSDSLIPKRVYIKYSVDFEEVPDRVSIMLQELSTNLTSLSSYFKSAAIDATIKPAIVLNSLPAYDGLLQKVSVRIRDTHEILANYMEILQEAAKIESEVRRQTEPRVEERALEATKSVTTLVKAD